MWNPEMPSQPTPFEMLEQQTQTKPALQKLIKEIKELTNNDESDNEMDITNEKEERRHSTQYEVQILLDEINKAQQKLWDKTPDWLFDTKYFLMWLHHPEFTQADLMNLDSTLSYINIFKQNNNLEALSNENKDTLNKIDSALNDSDTLNKIEDILKNPSIDGIKWLQQLVYDNLPNEKKDDFVINNQKNGEWWDWLYNNGIHDELCTIIEWFVDNRAWDDNDTANTLDDSTDDTATDETGDDSTGDSSANLDNDKIGDIEFDDSLIMDDDTDDDIANLDKTGDDSTGDSSANLDKTGDDSTDDSTANTEVNADFDVFTRDFLDTTLEDTDNTNINYNGKNIALRKHMYKGYLTYLENNPNNKIDKRVSKEIDNVLDHPNKKNIQKLQKFLYKRIEKNYNKISNTLKELGININNPADFQSKNQRNGERDGLFGKTTGDTLLMFLAANAPYLEIK